MLSVGYRCGVVHVKSNTALKLLIQHLELVTFLLPLHVSSVSSGYVYLLQASCNCEKAYQGGQGGRLGKAQFELCATAQHSYLYPISGLFNHMKSWTNFITSMLICHVFCVFCYWKHPDKVTNLSHIKTQVHVLGKGSCEPFMCQELFEYSFAMNSVLSPLMMILLVLTQTQN